jgi:hypothetical protein
MAFWSHLRPFIEIRFYLDLEKIYLTKLNAVQNFSSLGILDDTLYIIYESRSIRSDQFQKVLKVDWVHVSFIADRPSITFQECRLSMCLLCDWLTHFGHRFRKQFSLSSRVCSTNSAELIVIFDSEWKIVGDFIEMESPNLSLSMNPSIVSSHITDFAVAFTLFEDISLKRLIRKNVAERAKTQISFLPKSSER